MQLTLTPTFHTSLLVVATILIIYALFAKDKYAHFVGLAMLVFELGRYLFLFPSERLHMSLDLLIIGSIGIGFLLTRFTTIKILLAGLGLAAVLGHHYTDFISSSDNIYADNVDTDLELLVQFDNQQNLAAWMSAHDSDYDLTYPLFRPQDSSFLLDEYVGVNIDDNSHLEQVITELSKVKGVSNVEMNELIYVEQELVLDNKKILNDPQLNKQWVSKPLQLEDYHRLVSERMSISSQPPSIIAILDTGVEATHEDLKGNYKSTSARYDKDVKGHGTHCAGVAAAVTGNNLGIASLLPSESPVKVTSIKVLGDRGIGTQKMIIDGIIEAADRGYDVISMSLGGITNDKREAAYAAAIAYANAKGAIVVTAAGNAGRDARRHSPANSPGVITVTATGPDGRLASFANAVNGLKRGIAAPGVNIYSTIPSDGYEAYSGTSMATPFVSGLIGLMKYYNPSITTDQLYALLRDNSDNVEGVPVFNPLRTMEAFFEQQETIAVESD